MSHKHEALFLWQANSNVTVVQIFADFGYVFFQSNQTIGQLCQLCQSQTSMVEAGGAMERGPGSVQSTLVVYQLLPKE